MPPGLGITVLEVLQFLQVFEILQALEGFKVREVFKISKLLELSNNWLFLEVLWLLQLLTI